MSWPRLATRMPRAPSRHADAFGFQDVCERPLEMSSSSRAISRGAISITVTSLPKRRYICANSSPM